MTATATAGAPATWTPEPWIVHRAERETADVVRLEIAPRTPRSSPGRQAVQPGQFLMLYVFGIGEAPISVSGLGGSGTVEHTVRDVGPVTHALCQLAPGDTVGVRGPFGSSWPLADAALPAADGGRRDLLLAAGGIGLAPVRPVLEAVAAQRGRVGDAVLLHGARQPADLLFRADVERWRGAGIQVEQTVDHGDSSWSGHVGVVTTLIRTARFRPHETVAMLCGPEVMMRFMAAELTERGVPTDRIHVSLERNMQCAVGFCGHCQLGPDFVCLDGPVLPWSRVGRRLAVAEL